MSADLIFDVLEGVGESFIEHYPNTPQGRKFLQNHSRSVNIGTALTGAAMTMLGAYELIKINNNLDEAKEKGEEISPYKRVGQAGLALLTLAGAYLTLDGTLRATTQTGGLTDWVSSLAGAGNGLSR